MLRPSGARGEAMPERREVLLHGVRDPDFQNCFNRHREYCGQRHQVIDGGQGYAVLPVVNCLRRCKTQHPLQLADGNAALLPQRPNILTGSSLTTASSM